MNKLANSHQYNIVSLGSSRILQFREQMFDSSFYNAGYTVSSIKEFKPFLESIPNEKHPKFLLINLDQWMFNQNWDNLSEPVPFNLWSDSFDKIPSNRTFINVYSDLFKGKYLLNILFNTDNQLKIGLQAIVNNTGLRQDGSLDYGKQIEKLLSKDSTAFDYLYSDTYNRIDNGNMRFEYGDKVNQKAMRELQNFLIYCKQNKIHVIAFLPPFADVVLKKMKLSGHYKYLENLYNLLYPTFNQYNFELYDFSSVKFCNSNDEETIDGFHGGEITYLKLLIQILKTGSRLNEVANINKLERDLKRPINRYKVYQ